MGRDIRTITRDDVSNFLTSWYVPILDEFMLYKITNEGIEFIITGQVCYSNKVLMSWQHLKENMPYEARGWLIDNGFEDIKGLDVIPEGVLSRSVTETEKWIIKNTMLRGNMRELAEYICRNKICPSKFISTINRDGYLNAIFYNKNTST